MLEIVYVNKLTGAERAGMLAWVRWVVISPDVTEDTGRFLWGGFRIFADAQRWIKEDSQEVMEVFGRN